MFKKALARTGQSVECGRRAPIVAEEIVGLLLCFRATACVVDALVRSICQVFFQVCHVGCLNARAVFVLLPVGTVGSRFVQRNPIAENH